MAEGVHSIISELESIRLDLEWELKLVTVGIGSVRGVKWDGMDASGGSVIHTHARSMVMRWAW